MEKNYESKKKVQKKNVGINKGRCFVFCICLFDNTISGMSHRRTVGRTGAVLVYLQHVVGNTEEYRNTSKFCSQQMHTLYFVFARHFTSLPTCFDPCGLSSGHLIHWTFSRYYYTIHISLYNSL
jgi:hypothetical protein